MRNASRNISKINNTLPSNFKEEEIQTPVWPCEAPPLEGSDRARLPSNGDKGLVVHHTNIAILGKTLESIDSRRALHRMVFRARRLSNIVPFF